MKPQPPYARDVYLWTPGGDRISAKARTRQDKGVRKFVKRGVGLWSKTDSVIYFNDFAVSR